MKMSKRNMQRILGTTKREALRTERTWFVECFNNKIKIVFLILMWTLIWRRSECMLAVDNSNQAVNDNNNNNQTSYSYKQLDINNISIDDNKVVKPLYLATNDEIAKRQKNSSPAPAAVPKWNDVNDKQMTMMEGDQFDTINETLKIHSWESVIGKRSGEHERRRHEKGELLVAADSIRIEPLMVYKLDGTKSKLLQQTSEEWTIKTKTSTTIINNTTGYKKVACATNSMQATAMNTNAKINEHQNERNNENENVKRPEVVDSGTAVKATAPTKAITQLTKLPAKVATIAVVAPNSGGQQKISEKIAQANEQTIKGSTHYSPHTPESRQVPKAKAQVNTPPMAADVAARLQHQLIYEFAIKYKHIPRVTFFTCRRLNGQRKQNDKATANNFAQQQMTYLNMQTIDILQRLHGTKGTNKKIRPTGGKRTVKLNTDKVTTKRNAATTYKMTAASKAADRYARKVRSNVNINNKRGHSTITDTLTKKVILKNDGSVLGNGSGSMSRVAAIDTSTAAATVASEWDILIKVVHIDQLINKRPNAVNTKYTNNNTNNNNNNKNGNKYNLYAQQTLDGIRDFRSGGYVRSAEAAAAGTRNAYLNANWLTQVLRDDGNRQIVVLNLACGAASRRLLEMASNKAMFNSTYHWLLIEDYTFSRETGNDDNDESHNKKNSNNNDINCNVTDELENNERDNNNNNDNESNNFTDKFYQQNQTEKLQQNETASETVMFAAPAPTVVSASVSATSFASANIINATATVTNNEDNIEIIEKYLEKINININTELILAKRHTRRIRDDNKVCAGGDLMRGCCCYMSDSESATNNTLQRKDYYELYDVWSPGLQYGGQLNISEIGYFALDDGLQIALWYRRSTTITRRMDMKMARIRCLIVITNKNLTDTLEHYLTTRYDTHLDSMNRFNFALLSHVRDLFNFSFVLSKTSTWGYLKNGKFDGMIGALVRKQADIGGSPIFFRIERAKVIDYTTRTWVARPCFIFRHPRSTKKDRIVFLQPFSNIVWILLGFCGIFTICFLWLLTTMERRFEAVGVAKQLGQNTRVMSINAVKQQSAIVGNYELLVRCFSTRTTMAAMTTRTTSGSTMHCCIINNNKNTLVGHTKEQRKQKLGKLLKHNKVAEEQKKVKRISFRHCMLGCGEACCGQTTGTNVAQQRVSLFFESMLFYVSSICQQGLTFSTNFFSGRCIVITSLLFAFAIYQFYSASIVGTLLMEKPKTIRTLRDLIHSSLEVGIEDIPYNRDYFLRTKDPVAIELYAKKVTSIPTSGDTLTVAVGENSTVQLTTEIPDAQKAKIYRDILHSHEMGAHAKTNEASNWYDPEYGVNKIRRGKFAFHVDVATAYKIIADKFTEKEICDLTEIQLFPPQKMVNIVQKGSPLRKMITYGLRRVTETGLTDYQRKVWHSPKPRCIKQIHTDDLRVDLQTFASALFILIFGYAASLLALSIEIIQHKLWQRYHYEKDEEEAAEKHQNQK